MKYVKLTAKPDTWFKEGTEAYDYESRPPNLKRITLKDWENCVSFNGIVGIFARGVCVDDDTDEEVWDGEFCMCSDFEVEIVDETF